MGARNYLVEGVSGVGKTAVAKELQRRGHHVVHGDRELAYKGDPGTGEPLHGRAYETLAEGFVWLHEHHLWDLDRVRSVVSDRRHAISFLCGGSRNFSRFIDLLDGVFVLEVDYDTLMRRLSKRQDDEFGGRPAERELIARLHATRKDIPRHGVVIDAARPLVVVADDILSRCGEAGQEAYWDQRGAQTSPGR